MSASSRLKIIVPLVSAISLVGLCAQAQDSGNTPRQPPGAGPAPQSNQVAPPHAGRAAPPHAGQARVNPGAAGGPPPHGRSMARGPAPARDFGGRPYRGQLAWEGGRWRHEMHNGRYGWWWDVGGVWYFYPQRLAGPPAYISEVY